MHFENNFKLYFDGCSKGNPGLAGAGAVIYNNNEELWSNHLFIGDNITNNVAEYTGLIFGMQKAYEMNIKNIIIKGDSLLVINQMLGKYKCNSQNLIILYNTAKELEQKFEFIEYQHILRNLNKRADKLANDAVIYNIIEK